MIPRFLHRTLVLILVLLTTQGFAKTLAELDSTQQAIMEQNLNAISIWHKQPNEARLHLNTAMVMASQEGQELGIRVTQLNLGRLDVRLGNWQVAQEKLLESTAFFLESEYNLWRQTSHLAKAEYYLAKGDYMRAQESLGLLIAEKSFRKGSGIDKMRQRLYADCLLRMGKYDQAMEQFQYVVEQYKMEGNHYGVGMTHQAIGKAWFREGDYGKAKLRHKRARAQFEKAGDRYELAHTQLLLGKCEHGLGQLDLAVNSIRTAISIAETLDAIQLKLDGYQSLSAVYKTKGDYALALEAHETAASMKDSLLNTEAIKIAEDLDAKYEVRQRQQRETEMVSKVAKTEKQNSALLWSLLVTATLAILTIVAYRGKRKSVSQLAVEKERVESHQKKILQSINYARNIQKSIVTPMEEIKASSLKSSFLFFEPKDKVSGDIYFFHQDGDQVIMAAIDCTGHGIPGAFMALIGHTLLTDIVVQRKVKEPAEILRLLNLEVISTLRQSSDELHSQAGMDMALCQVNTKTRAVKFAGARNHLYKVQNGSLEVIKSTPMSVGGKPLRRERTIDRTYEQHEFTVEGDDAWIYMYSDGFMDQYGGKDRKKYNSRNFKGLLTTCSHHEAEDQLGRLKAAFFEWKGDEEQIDDVLVIGIRV